MSKKYVSNLSRRLFLQKAGAAGAIAGTVGMGNRAANGELPVTGDGTTIPGFEETHSPQTKSVRWQPHSDRKVRVGIAGYGLCKFGAQFGFQNHPNVEVVAVSDLIAQNRDELARVCRCPKSYPSCEEMLADEEIEAVFIATDAPSHARLAIAALHQGKHVASAVPAVFGSLDDAQRLFEAVKASGMKYMMFETSCYHADLYAFHKRYEAGELGKIIYSEGEYFHYFGEPLGGYNYQTKQVDKDGWRKGLPPQWYPTHSTAYHIGVTGGSFTEVACMGMPSIVPHLQAENNQYGNPYGTEIAMFRTDEGGTSRMAVTWDILTNGGERGRVYGQKNESTNLSTERPALPPGVAAGGHGGSHGHLMAEFIDAILRDREPWLDIAKSLNMTVSGIVAHQSALRDGELLKVPQYA